ncbi:S9 family peptidase [Chitinophaga barathri]|uniref:S9 family peptidase n=1 Tax=Chitinophaga barathri TaxID=1647451 RepID=A0A3N4MG48_9BACT|nr:S9 family peptidase [Chitinophaga barathri]RPD40667.1 S9 family peptidase [Chitinophaga barathri]
MYKSLPVWIAGLTMLAAMPAGAQEKKELTFDQIFTRPVSITEPLPVVRGWANKDHYIEARSGQALSVDVKTGSTAPYTPPPATGATVSVKKNDVYVQMPNGGEEIRVTNNEAVEKNPTLSPDEKYVAFTRNNNLYAVEVATKKEIQYTTDGSDVIYNGWASWVYYEEILGRPSRYRAFWWSPDSKKIAFMRFDDSKVPVFPIYSEVGQHGFLENTRYPKAGDTNPEVKLAVVPVAGGKITWADFNEKDDQYFGQPFWSPDGSALWAQWMPREQNNLIIYAIDPQTGAKKALYDEKQKTWIDWFTDIYFLQGNKGFIVKSDISGWDHLYLHNMDGSLKQQLTSGNWRVREILLIDEKKQAVYFTARKEATTRFDLYKANLKGGEPQRLTFGEFSHDVKLSPGGDYFITTYSNLNTPPRMALLDEKGKVIRELGNARGANFDSYKLAPTELKTYKTRDGLTLPLTIIWPLNMEPGKKYPVLVSIYGGPDAGTVYDTWRANLASQWYAKEGLIQVAIDNRAAGHLGKVGMNYIHRQLGKYEIEDYMDAATWLGTQPGVDASRMGITGGSFGGYMSCMALTYGAEVFTHGMANFSVTDWQLYDSHYTERFMDLPKDNVEGYKVTSVLTHAQKYKGLLRIVHGTMDDNVHLQNTIQLVNLFQDQGKHFELMLYPGERHGWGGAKGAHSRNETYRFVYANLLQKPLPKYFQGTN